MDARLQGLPRIPRRGIVAMGLLGYPLAFGGVVALRRSGLSRWLILAIFLVVIALTLAALVAAYGYARGRIDGRGVRVDERDQALRQQAYASGHRVLAAIVILTVLLVEGYLATGHTVRVNGNTFLPALVWVSVYIPALPTLMLTWIEPSAPADA